MFESKTSIWEALGLYFGALGLHFGVFLEALTPLGTTLATLGQSIEKCSIFSAEYSPHLAQFSNPNLQKLQKHSNSWRPESSQEKNRHPTSPEVSQSGIRVVTTICLERSRHARLGHF